MSSKVYTTETRGVDYPRFKYSTTRTRNVHKGWFQLPNLLTFKRLGCCCLHKIPMLQQRYRIFFFPEKVRWPFNQSKPKIVYFFFQNPEKKNTNCFLTQINLFLGNKGSSQGLRSSSYMTSAKFIRSKICIFFFCRSKKKNTAFSINQSIFSKNV